MTKIGLRLGGASVHLAINWMQVYFQCAIFGECVYDIVRVYNQLMFISEAFADALVLPSTRSLADKMLIQSDSSPKFDFLVLDHKISPDLLRANLLPRLWKYDKDWVKGLVALVCTKPLTEYKSFFSAQFLGNVCMVFVRVYKQLMFISKAFADALCCQAPDH